MSIIVNTDYESMLFENRPSLKLVRELEFLGLWLNDSVKNVTDYSIEYLVHIQKHTGHKPMLVKHDPKSVNWWGELKNLEKERFLNSKETSLQISQRIGESFGRVLNHISEIESLNNNGNYLFKSFSGVSGRGHKSITQVSESDFPMLAEELHERGMDFSTYILSSGECISYQNFIGPRFSYKGSFFDLDNANSLFNLDFVKNHDLDWKGHLDKIKKITEVVRYHGDQGFSVDSYTFDNQIRTLCEINYRRTMGITAFEIAKKVSNKRFGLFLIFKPTQSYHEILMICESKEVLVLSHDKNMFTYLLISTNSKDELEKKLNDLSLAFGTRLSVEIE